jgi:transposase-like protein
MKSGLVDRTPDSKSAGRRRFWSSDEKRRMVAESFAPVASVSKVAQRYDAVAFVHEHIEPAVNRRRRAVQVGRIELVGQRPRARKRMELSSAFTRRRSRSSVVSLSGKRSMARSPSCRPI